MEEHEPWRFDRAALRFAARRSYHGFMRHRGIDSAAALTYYAALALFPSALVVVSSFAVAGGGRREALSRISDILAEFLRPDTLESVQGPLRALLNLPNPGTALLIGFLLSIWTVSNYATAFGRAMNSVYEVEEGRQFYKFRALMLAVALLLILGFAVITVILLGSPTVATAIAASIGIADGWILAWNILKWPVLVFVAFLLVAVLYFFSPNIKHVRLRWVSWGAALALVAWGLATAGFAVYVTTVDSYNRVYGWIGGAVALLLWLYITNIVLVIGAEVDAELVRVRQLKAGIAAEAEIRLPLRDTRRNLMLARQRARDEASGKAMREQSDQQRHAASGDH